MPAPLDVEAGSSVSVPNHRADGSAALTAAAPGGGGKDASGNHHPSLAKVVLLSSAGNVLEWMDFSVYAYFSLEIGKAFFPPGPAEAQLIESFSVFAGAFVVRPLGGVIFGWIGDRRSKQFALQLSLFLMALSTTLIGCLPTYAQIGRAAPILLTLLRMLQGLAVGGQLVGTMVFVHSHAPNGKHGFYGGLVLSGAVFGVLLGAVVGTALHESMPERALQRHGFRIPFLCGFLVALAGLGLHKYVPDVAEIEEDVGPGSPPTSPSSSAAATAATPSVGGGAPAAAAAVVAGGGSTPSSGSESRALSLSASGDGGASVAAAAPAPAAAAAGVEVGVKTPPNPLKDLMRGHKLELVLGTTVLFLYCTAFYESLVWLPTYLTTLVPRAPVEGAFAITTVHLALAVLLFPVSGHVADLYGFFPVMLAGGMFLGLTAPLAFYILRFGTPLAAFFGQLIFVIGLTVHGGPMALFMTEHMQSSPHLYTAIAVSYNVAQATLGGAASLISTTLVKALHGYGAAAWLSLIAVVSLSALVVGYHPRRGLVVVRQRGRWGK